MSELETAVAGHYDAGDVYARIEQALRQAGLDPNGVSAADLRGADEFHIGGAAATDALLAQIDGADVSRAIDIGSGLGGAARHLADAFGAEVLGVDLTPSFVEAARRLSALVGSATRFEVGSALALPAQDGAFDLATLLHVGMNIPDKAALFAEAFRVLRPGGVFAVYDVMALRDEPLEFPLPWASTPAQSHLASPAAYRAAAEGAGFEVSTLRDRGDFARAFFAEARAEAQAGQAPKIHLGLIMNDRPAKIANMVSNLAAGRYAPTEMISRKPS